MKFLIFAAAMAALVLLLRSREMTNLEWTWGTVTF